MPIEVDDDTGVWSTDGLPMLYVPQHFLVNNHKAVEARIGRDAHAELLFAPGHESAWTWCEHESAEHALAGEEVFRHYLRRLSQRGWAQFHVEELDCGAGHARVRVDHSVFVAQYGESYGQTVCYMFAGWLCGALEWAASDLGTPVHVGAAEVGCGAEPGRDRCVFAVAPVGP